MTNPDELESVPGAERHNLQGTVWAAATEEELREGLEQAFGYRGDVTLTRRDGTQIEGYVFDRRTGPTLSSSAVRLIDKQNGNKLSIPYSEIQGLAFTGRDTAAGKSWEAWMAKYWQKKLAGERNIELRPETLSEE